MFGDLLMAAPDALRRVFDVPVFGLIAAVNEVRVDLKSAPDGALLITNGGLGDIAPQWDEVAAKACSPRIRYRPASSRRRKPASN
jgi:hypothetical protein